MTKMNLSPNDFLPSKSGPAPSVVLSQHTRFERVDGAGRSEGSSHDEGCECDECEPLTADDIRYLKAQAVWDDLGLGGL